MSHRIPTIRVGIGGWEFDPWKQSFYPRGLPASQRLHWASRRLTSIEINGTFYRLQKPETFAKWREQTPEGFEFSLKAPRYIVQKRALAESGEALERFFNSGLAELGDRLGPLLWQFAPTKRFDAADLDAFLGMLPKQLAGRPLRHALEPRHESFRSAEYLALARRHGVATVFDDSDKYPALADPTADFIYIRTMRSDAAHTEGYAPEALDAITDCLRCWQAGGEPAALPRVEPAASGATPRDVYCYVISGAKEKAPAAAQGLIERLR